MIKREVLPPGEKQGRDIYKKNIGEFNRGWIFAAPGGGNTEVSRLHEKREGGLEGAPSPVGTSCTSAAPARKRETERFQSNKQIGVRRWQERHALAGKRGGGGGLKRGKRSVCERRTTFITGQGARRTELHHEKNDRRGEKRNKAFPRFA